MRFGSGHVLLLGAGVRVAVVREGEAGSVEGAFLWRAGDRSPVGAGPGGGARLPGWWGSGAGSPGPGAAAGARGPGYGVSVLRCAGDDSGRTADARWRPGLCGGAWRWSAGGFRGLAGVAGGAGGAGRGGGMAGSREYRRGRACESRCVRGQTGAVSAPARARSPGVRRNPGPPSGVVSRNICDIRKERQGCSPHVAGRRR
ncbi:hypothetical protein KPATCC21470_0167 [Kitasatospora purpeofusca]